VTLVVPPRLRDGRWRVASGIAGLALIAAVGITLALTLGGGSTTPTLPTTGAFAPISVPRPIVPAAGFQGPLIADPDSMLRQGQDLQMLVAAIPGTNRYRLTVTNVSSIGFINSFEWYPPTGISLVKVVGSSVGRCVASGLHGFGGNQFKTVTLNPDVVCSGLNLKPPSCTCKGDGGVVQITFVATGRIGMPGAARVAGATPVFEQIPSYPGAQTSPDLPVCTHGQVSTRGRPCTGG
jgi:hypothetical protein